MPVSLSAPTLTGPLLSLRPWRFSDGPALEPACGDPEICRFTTVPQQYTPKEAQEWILRQHQRLFDGAAIVLGTVPVGDERPVGMVGLFGLDQPTRTGRLGYWVIREARGRKLASEAVRMLAFWAVRELDVDAFHLAVEPSNAASRRVAAALGAVPTETVKCRLRGEDVTLLRYAVSATDVRLPAGAQP
jgi:RimJ/RimL family protein N-acetyltransferase